MSEPEASSARERMERHLRSVRTKLITARRQLQTVGRQAGMARGARRMDQDLARAEQLVTELEHTEADLLKQLGLDQLAKASTIAESMAAAVWNEMAQLDQLAKASTIAEGEAPGESA